MRRASLTRGRDLGSVRLLRIVAWMIMQLRLALPFYLFGALGIVWAAVMVSVLSRYAREHPAM